MPYGWCAVPTFFFIDDERDENEKETKNYMHISTIFAFVNKFIKSNTKMPMFGRFGYCRSVDRCSYIVVFLHTTTSCTWWINSLIFTLFISFSTINGQRGLLLQCNKYCLFVVWHCQCMCTMCVSLVFQQKSKNPLRIPERIMNALSV